MAEAAARAGIDIRLFIRGARMGKVPLIQQNVAVAKGKAQPPESLEKMAQSFMLVAAADAVCYGIIRQEEQQVI